MPDKKRPNLRSAMARLAPQDASPGSGGTISAPAETEPPRSLEEPARRDQYGRNRDPNYQQLNFNVPKGLRRRFKAKLEAEGKLMQDVLTDAIREYVGDFLEGIPDFPS